MKRKKTDFRRALQAAREAGVPLMVHHNNSTVPTCNMPGMDLLQVSHSGHNNSTVFTCNMPGMDLLQVSHSGHNSTVPTCNMPGMDLIQVSPQVVCLFVGCLMSQQHANVSQERHTQVHG